MPAIKRARIWAVGNVKGGVGKTTLAANLAIAMARKQRDVLLIDGDEQGTGMAFTELRTTELGGGRANYKPDYTAVALLGANIRSQVRQLASKYDDIVIDVGGRDTGSLRAALTVADVILIPVKPRSFDLWAVDQTADLINEARQINEGLRAIAVINEADTQGQDNQAAMDFIRGVGGVELASVVLARRKAFPNAAAAGRSVLEYSDPKAIDEFTQLLDVLLNLYTNDIKEVAYGNR